LEVEVKAAGDFQRFAARDARQSAAAARLKGNGTEISRSDIYLFTDRPKCTVV
jgi:hypothetical protein